MKAAFYTLGCKVNQYDTQMMIEKLKNNGYSIASFDEIADVYVINTCTVTQISDKKSRNIISRAKRKNPSAIIVVCGCYSQVAADETRNIDGVNIVLGTKNRKDIADYINKYIATNCQIVETTNDGNIENEFISEFSDKTRAILKIEDGCRNFCSYCLIPFARGKIVSKQLETIVEEAKSLSSNGYKEIVLTGIHLSSYGSDLNSIDLADAINAVSEISSIERIRLGSLEPMIITQSFINKIKNNTKLCPSFHLSLQSGCNKVLKLMNRKYTTEDYTKAVELLRDTFEDCSVTTDIIVGFPGEDDLDFNETKAYVKKIGFSKIHIFPYSKRKGTKAAKMNDQVDKCTKSKREKELSMIENELRSTFHSRMLSKKVSVLVETIKDGVCYGHTANYIPVEFYCKENICNRFIDVKITQASKDSLFGEIL